MAADHYYSKDPVSKSQPLTWHYTLRENRLSFTSDYGVFSKNEVDFGSKLLIETFDEPAVSGDILDVGCGYGPIGIGIAKAFPNRKVVMVDVNRRALELAKMNVTNNGLENIEVLESDVYSSLSQNQPFSAILTNPPIRAGKKVVHKILEESYSYLVQGGNLWVVIQKKQGAPSAKKKLEEVFGNAVVVKKEKGYFILKVEKI